LHAEALQYRTFNTYMDLPILPIDIVVQNGYYARPISTYTLAEFNSRAKQILRENPRDPTEFIRFMLTGEMNGEALGLEVFNHQALLEPGFNDVEPRHPISVSRDYDCILGITEDIVVNHPVTIYPISDPGDAIMSSIHVGHRFTPLTDTQVSTPISLV
jgi:hypothetical protein